MKSLLKKTYGHLSLFPRDMWILSIATFLNQMGVVAFAFLLLYLTQHLGFSLAQSSIVYIVFGTSLTVFSFIAGNIIDRIGPEKTIIISLLGNALVMFSFPYAHHYLSVLIMSVLWGIFYGAYRPCAQTLVSLLTPHGEQKIAFSVYRLSINLGVSMGPLIGGYLVARNFASIFYINATASFLAALLIGFGLKNIFNNKPQKSSVLTLLQTVSILKSDKLMRWFLMGLFPITMVFFQHESTLAVFLVNNHHFSYHFYGFLFTVNTLMIVCCEIVLNVAMINWSPRLSFIAGSGFIALGFLGFSVASTSIQIIGLTMIWTLGEMIFYPAGSAFVANCATAQNRGTYMGLYSMISNAGQFLGLGGGAILLHYVGGTLFWILCGLLWIPCLIIFYQIKSLP